MRFAQGWQSLLVVLHEDYVKFTFNDETYSVFVENIEADELESLLNELNI